jgi:hypothetical protein
MESNVDFPHPLGPKMHVILFFEISRSNPSKTTFLPNRFSRPRTVM